MDTNVRFEPSGKTSLVAAGQTILGAARSLGVEIPTQCGAVGKCDSCAVFIEQGAEGASELTDAETSFLSPERLAAGERLACQVKVFGVEVVVRVPTVVERATIHDEEKKAEEKKEESKRQRDPRIVQLREEFDRLPFERKVSALAELGFDAASDAVGEVVKITQWVGSEISGIFTGNKTTKKPDTPDGSHEPSDKPGDESSAA